MTQHNRCGLYGPPGDSTTTYVQGAEMMVPVVDSVGLRSYSWRAACITRLLPGGGCCERQFGVG
jgi:hypothetical protein